MPLNMNKKLVIHNGVFFFFNDTATTEIYTLSLHDALPISRSVSSVTMSGPVTLSMSWMQPCAGSVTARPTRDRKSTRLNSSHGYISYAVFCLKKKKRETQRPCARRAYPIHQSLQRPDHADR